MCEARPATIQADRMQRELDVSLLSDYEAAGLPLLLHQVMYAFCICFHARWGFLTTSLRIPLKWHSGTSGEKSISHGNPYKMKFFLAYFTLQGMLIMLNIMHSKVEDHENHMRWIYLRTVLNFGVSRKYASRCIVHLLFKVIMVLDTFIQRPSNYWDMILSSEASIF